MILISRKLAVKDYTSTPVGNLNKKALNYFHLIGASVELLSRQRGWYEYRITLPDNSILIVGIVNVRTSIHTLKRAVTRLESFVDNVLIIHPHGRTSSVMALSEFSVTLVNHQRLAHWMDLRSRVPDYRHIHLHFHNENAFLSYKSRGLLRDAFLQATGAGKSYLIAAITQDIYPQKVAIVSSSRYILEQQKGIIGNSISATYLTYNFLAVSTQRALSSAKGCSVMILDEFHRAGAENWQKGVLKLESYLDPIKIIGTTATHIRHLDESRDMANELFDGNVCHYLPLTSAIASGALRSPRYISGIYCLEEIIDSYEDRIKESALNLNQKEEALSYIKSTRVGWNKIRGVEEIIKEHLTNDDERFLMFCQDLEHLDEMKLLLHKWLRTATDKPVHIHTLAHVHGKAVNQGILRQFKMSPPHEIHILATIDMLNEGKHIKGVDGAFLFRKTISQNLFYQQIGRVFDAGAEKNPLIFDLVGNISNVHDVLFYDDLVEQQERVDEKRKALGLESIIYNGYMVDDSHGTLDKLKKIDSIIGNSIVSNDFRVEVIEKYHKAYGTAFIKQGTHFGDIEISMYASKIRKDYHAGYLSRDCIERLEKLSFSFQYTESLALHSIAVIKKFKEDNGHMRIPDDFSVQGVSIQAWISQERKKYREGNLSETVRSGFAELGMSLSPLEDAEALYLEALSSFVRNHGHANVPYNYEVDGCKLGSWCVKLRIEANKKKLKGEKRKVLENLGFVFDKKEFEFNERYELLQGFSRLHGHLRLPKGYTENNINLYNYLRGLRQRIKEGSSVLSSEQLDKLLAIGFKSGKPVESPDVTLSKLESYVRKNGSLARLSVVDAALADRLYRLRKSGEKGRLSASQRSRLDALSY